MTDERMINNCYFLLLNNLIIRKILHGLISQSVFYTLKISSRIQIILKENLYCVCIDEYTSQTKRRK